MAICERISAAGEWRRPNCFRRPSIASGWQRCTSGSRDIFESRMMTSFGNRHSKIGRIALTALLAGTLAACSSLGASGPTGSSVRGATGDSFAGAGIMVVELDDQAVQRTAGLERSLTLAEFFGETAPVSTVIGTGDVLDVTVWEAPPAVLFGAAGM